MNQQCRAAKVGFYSVESFGYFGLFFGDLGTHEYLKSRVVKGVTKEETVSTSFNSLQSIVDTKLSDICAKSGRFGFSKVYYAWECKWLRSCC